MIKIYNNIQISFLSKILFLSIFYIYFSIPFFNLGYISSNVLIVLLIFFSCFFINKKLLILTNLEVYWIALIFFLMINILFKSKTDTYLDYFYNYSKLIIFYLVFSIFLWQKKLRDKFIILYSIFFCISCLVSILQFLNIDFAWELRKILNPDIQNRLLRQFQNRLEVFGLAYSNVQLGYQFSLAFPFIVYLYKISKNQYLKFLLSFSIFLMISTVYIGNITTSIITIIITFFLFNLNFFRKVFFMKNFKFYALTLSLILVYFLTLIEYTGPHLGRLSSLVLGLFYIKTFLSGLSSYGFEELRILYIQNDARYVDLVWSIPHWTNVFENSLHNSYLNLGVFEGIVFLFFMIILKLLIFIELYKMLKKNFRSNLNKNNNMICLSLSIFLSNLCNAFFIMQVFIREISIMYLVWY